MRASDFSGEVFKGLLTSRIGFAVFDRKFRYRLVNEALAAMHRVPAEAHSGESLRSITGKAAGKIEPALDAVFATGKALPNFELIDNVPTRPEGVHWTGTHFPIRDERGKVKKVGVFVTEVGSEVRNGAVVTVNPQLLEKLVTNTSRTEEFVSRLMLLNGCSLIRAESERIPLAAPPVNQSDCQPGHGSLVTLSHREREIVCSLANGLSNKEISAALSISVKTVECHRSRIFLKLKLHSLVSLVRYAIRCHIVDA
jgi:DNA-binding CsgD family transcriptional regulator